jgi:hypothetical protein
MAFALPACASHETVTFVMDDNRGEHTSAISRVTQIEERFGGRWEASITLHPKQREQAEAWAGALTKGINNAFYLSPPHTTKMIYEASTGASPGAPKVNGATQKGTTLVTDGWTTGFVIKWGDYIEVPANGYSWLLKNIGGDVTATGAGGDAELDVWPPLYWAPDDNAVIRTSNPRAEMLLKRPRHEIEVNRFEIYRQSFECFQWIRG